MYFFKKYKNSIMVVLVVMILLITIGISNKEKDKITKSENFLGNVLYPINRLVYSIGNRISSFIGDAGDLFKNKKENEKLELEVLKLQDEKRELENIIGKSDLLKAEASLLKKSDLKLVSAKVISKEPGNWYNKFTIDRGSSDRIKEGSTIIQAVEIDGDIVQEGLIGKVIKVGDNFAKVSSAIDEENSVSFKIIRTQDGGMVQGNIDSTMEGYLFDRKADVVVGDKLYTSGLGNGYESDLYIGEVEEVVQLEEELMKKIVVKPAIDFKKIYKVFAIIE